MEKQPNEIENRPAEVLGVEGELKTELREISRVICAPFRFRDEEWRAAYREKIRHALSKVGASQ